MAVNTNALFITAGNNTSDGQKSTSAAMAPTLTTAAADYDGSTATHNKVVFTANATNGSRIVGLRFKSKGTNIQTVARIYLNNGGAATTAANNSPLGEQVLLATTAVANNSMVDVDWFFPGGYAVLEPGFRVIVGLGTTVAAGWVCVPILGGDF